jgi:acyl dehydratase
MTNPITTVDELENEYKKVIGVEIDLNPQRFLTEVTRDNVLNFADAVGDNNPLWTNEAYAAKSRFGMVTAPPLFLYSVNHGSIPAHAGAIKVPIVDLPQLYAGAEVEVYRPIWLGDRLTVTGKAVNIVRKESKSVGPMLFLTGEALFVNQRKEPVGLIRTTICRFKAPNRQAIEFERTSKPGIEVKSPDILAYERKRRGAEPRFWEDTQIGEEMPAQERGILTMTEISRFGILVPPSLRRIEARREILEVGFEREASQKRAGLENASDYGPQRICWLGQYITDWMGDDGTLKKVTGQVRHPNIIGDISVIKGKVTNKYVSAGEHRVDCEFRVENQAGLVTAPGQATVVLPIRTDEKRNRSKIQEI